MTSDLLLQLEQKVAHAVEVIELLRMQIEELEDENKVLKLEHDKWRHDLGALIRRFDSIDPPQVPTPSPVLQRARVLGTQRTIVQEEEFMTV
jgi:FtsZ-binding cell division protein ZapB